MSELSDKYYSKKELKEIATEKHIPEKYFTEFIVFVEKYIKQMMDDEELGEDEISIAAIDLTVEYFCAYESEIQKGHSKEWSNKYAEYNGEHLYAFNNAYEAVKKIDSKKAKEELEIHCRAVGGDSLYTNYFIYLMENGDALADPDKQAAIYSAIFKQQIALGKSEVFAHEYSGLMADDEYSEIYCLWYAKTYDKCIQKGKPKEYATLYADKIGSYYSDFYGRYFEDDEFVIEKHEFNERKILGYMNAWEFSLQNEIDDFKMFIEFYVNIYLNSYYSDDRDYSIDERQIDVDVLSKTIERFTIYQSTKDSN